MLRSQTFLCRAPRLSGFISGSSALHSMNFYNQEQQVHSTVVSSNLFSSKRFFSPTVVKFAKKRQVRSNVSFADTLANMLHRPPGSVEAIQRAAELKLMEHGNVGEPTNALQLVKDGCKKWNDPELSYYQEQLFGTVYILPSDPYLLAYALNHCYKLHACKGDHHAISQFTWLLQKLTDGKLDFRHAEPLASTLFYDIRRVKKERNPLSTIVNPIAFYKWWKIIRGIDWGMIAAVSIAVTLGLFPIFLDAKF
jgi:hypothetical protein